MAILPLIILNLLFSVVNSTTFSSNTIHPTTSNKVSNHLMSTNNLDSNPDQGATNGTNVRQMPGSALGRNKHQRTTQIVSSIISTEKPVESRTESGDGGPNTTESLVSSGKKDYQGTGTEDFE